MQLPDYELFYNQNRRTPVCSQGVKCEQFSVGGLLKSGINEVADVASTGASALGQVTGSFVGSSVSNVLSGFGNNLMYILLIGGGVMMVFMMMFMMSSDE
jgi:hypothetical protein